MAAVTICSDFGAQKYKASHCFHCLPICLPWSDRIGCHDLSFLNVEFQASFFALLFHAHQEALAYTCIHAASFHQFISWQTHRLFSIPGLLIMLQLYILHFNIINMGRLEKAMAPYSSTLAWKIPWTEEPGGLQSMGLLGVVHDWATSLLLFTFMHWRRTWQPTPVFLPGESQGPGSLVAAICGITQSRTRLKWLSSSSSNMGWKPLRRLLGVEDF